MKIIHYLEGQGRLDDDTRAEALKARLEGHKYNFVAEGHWKLDGVKACGAIVSDNPEIVAAYEAAGIGQWTIKSKPKAKPAKKKRGRPRGSKNKDAEQGSKGPSPVVETPDPDMPAEWAVPEVEPEPDPLPVEDEPDESPVEPDPYEPKDIREP